MKIRTKILCSTAAIAVCLSAFTGVALASPTSPLKYYTHSYSLQIQRSCKKAGVQNVEDFNVGTKSDGYSCMVENSKLKCDIELTPALISSGAYIGLNGKRYYLDNPQANIIGDSTSSATNTLPVACYLDSQGNIASVGFAAHTFTPQS